MRLLLHDLEPGAGDELGHCAAERWARRRIAAAGEHERRCGDLRQAVGRVVVEEGVEESLQVLGRLLVGEGEHLLDERLNAPVQGTAADGLKLALALLWERSDECPGAVPVLVCHDEVVVECDEDRCEETKRWLEKAMIEAMDAVMNSAGEARVPVEVEARIARSWGEGV